MICHREGCDNPIPNGRRKFCCDDCAKLHHQGRRRQPLATLELALVNVLDTAKRTCLSCNEQFLSDGPWNRLCPKCKRRGTHR